MIATSDDGARGSSEADQRAADAQELVRDAIESSAENAQLDWRSAWPNRDAVFKALAMRT